MSDITRSEDIIIKELGLIQDVIKRMASNSFLVKGWAISLVVATLLFKGSQIQVFIAFIPLISFWILDAYYLRQERLYRRLYEWVIKNRKESDEFLFDLNANRFKDQVSSLTGVMFSETLIYFYVSMTLLLMFYILLMIILNHPSTGVIINGTPCIL